jgi:hypothetical protein
MYVADLTETCKGQVQTETYPWMTTTNKLKLSHNTHHVGTWWERRDSSHSFSTSALYEDEWSALRPGSASAPRKEPHRYPLYRRQGGLQSWSGYRGERKNTFAYARD